MTRRAARPLVVVLGVLALVLPAVVLLAAPARAHVGGGAAGSDFDARVLAVEPALPGVAVRVLSFGDELELLNATATDVEVPGYSGEPYLRIGPDGVWRNANSPATYVNLDRFGRTALPAHADPAAEPDWVQVSTEPGYVWHDHRTHWMSEGLLPPAVAADPTRAHRVSAWAVPVVHGGVAAQVRGELTWSPPPRARAVWPVSVLLALAPVAAALLARGPRPLGALMAVGGVAALYHAATTPEPATTVSSHAGALVSALLPGLLAAAVAAGGLLAARRGRGGPTALLAVVLGWLLLVQGLPDVDVLWTANVLATGPVLLTRATVAVLVALGAGSVVGGLVATRRSRQPAGSLAGQAGSPVTGCR
ncbi:hypothetical protein SAMN06893096_103223 [Geodermatophilus pulveris]|uniref:Uncharacterized protein n=1 Tax=Geodermatophilus pulveris TaxID=1564159 RepID=A0A239DKA8_9ACTN|nr:hypothetical protein [Geodermatophilus pulveris]SNS32481.1 hypothetical protein SAMN06893096_103223 [Geodermatophilus pulveris]